MSFEVAALSEGELPISAGARHTSGPGEKGMDRHGIWLVGTDHVELPNGCRVCYDRATRRWWAWWKDGTILRGDNDEESLFTTKDEAIQCIADRLALKTVHQRPEAKAAASSDLLAACEGLTAVIRALADRYVTDPDEFDYIKTNSECCGFLDCESEGRISGRVDPRRLGLLRRGGPFTQRSRR